MRYCEKCGNEIPDGQKFCSGCGTPLQNADPFEEVINPQTPTRQKKEPLHQKGWFVLLWCFFFPPAGIVMTWMKKDWEQNAKIVISAITAVWFFFIVITQ